MREGGGLVAHEQRGAVAASSTRATVTSSTWVVAACGGDSGELHAGAATACKASDCGE